MRLSQQLDMKLSWIFFSPAEYGWLCKMFTLYIHMVLLVAGNVGDWKYFHELVGECGGKETQAFLFTSPKIKTLFLCNTQIKWLIGNDKTIDIFALK